MRRKNHDAGAGAVLDIQPDLDAVVDTENESQRGSELDLSELWVLLSNVRIRRRRRRGLSAAMMDMI
jgi:hypothetical protein